MQTCKYKAFSGRVLTENPLDGSYELLDIPTTDSIFTIEDLGNDEV